MYTSGLRRYDVSYYFYNLEVTLDGGVARNSTICGTIYNSCVSACQFDVSNVDGEHTRHVVTYTQTMRTCQYFFPKYRVALFIPSQV